MRNNWTPLSRFPTSFSSTDPDPFSFIPSLGSVSASLLSRPWFVSKKMMAMGTEQFDAMQKIWLSKEGESQKNTKNLLNGDPRFAAEEWSSSRLFGSLAFIYTAWRKTLFALIDETPDLDEQTRLKARFFVEQIVEMVSPSNQLLLNPQALEEMKKTKGLSLVRGFRNWLSDMKKGNNMPSQSQQGAFTIGVDLANTPGFVVARNELCEVIQYSSTTEKVHSTPILIIPPWINKFYILDLGEQKSYVRYLVDQGHTVFLVSWKNPTKEMSQTTFDDYIIKGAQFAKDVVSDICGTVPAACGYCIGGTLLATAQAYFKAKEIPAFSSLTFFNAMVDFDDVGDIKVFIDERAIRHIEQNMENKGFLDGVEMGSSFNYLRSKDLLWSYFVDNYLLGKTPRPFDMLAWNEDCTRMPAKMHGWYLRNMYLNNLLRVPGALHIDNTPIDLGLITEDIFLVASESDHIALAKTVYRMHAYTKSKIQYVLASGGHIAGIVNHPNRKKGYHYTHEAISTPDHQDFTAWRERAEKKEGSWWVLHHAWLSERGEEEQEVPSIGSTKFPSIEEAPGQYVLEK